MAVITVADMSETTPGSSQHPDIPGAAAPQDSGSPPTRRWARLRHEWHQRLNPVYCVIEQVSDLYVSFAACHVCLARTRSTRLPMPRRRALDRFVRNRIDRRLTDDSRLRGS